MISLITGMFQQLDLSHEYQENNNNNNNFYFFLSNV